MRSASVFACVALALLPSCSLSREALGTPSGMDGGTSDGGRDAGLDAGDASDVGPIDTGIPDTGPVDTGIPDTGAPDTGTDVGMPDVGVDGGPCAACGPTQMCCADVCVDTTSSAAHCGSCDPCAPATHATVACSASACTIGTCTLGFADCNASYGDGCETTLGTLTNCRSCGEACATYANTTSACDASVGCTYACEAGYQSCNTASPDCETHTDVDAANCGSCGRTCRAGQTCVAGACVGWGNVTATGAPSPRSQHTAVWTGSRMIVWGGTGPGGELATGGIYDPATDTWTATSTTGAPSARRGHVAVWTGSRMIVWGGYGGTTSWVNDGASYDPATDTWTALAVSASVLPGARSRFAGVWSGTQLLVFGGWGPLGELGDGSRLDDTGWHPMTGMGAPSARRYFPSVWTGSRMLVWGGDVGDGTGLPTTSVFNNGAAYDPVANAWTGITNSGRPAARTRHVAVWTGTLMVVWSGWDGGEVVQTTGGRYNPTTDSWATVSTAPIPGRVNGTAVWSGSRMLVWGGLDGVGAPFFFDDGAAYDPVMDTWTTLSSVGAPTARADHTAVWTGSEMIVWGGIARGVTLGDGARLAP